MKYYYHENSDSVFIDKDIAPLYMGAEEIWEIGECVLGSMGELLDLLNKTEGFLKAFDINELLTKEMIEVMKEKDVMYLILNSLINVSKMSGAGSAAMKREEVANTEKMMEIMGAPLGGLFRFVLRTGFDPMWVTHINKIEVSDSDDMLYTDITFEKIVGLLLSVRAMNNDLRSMVSGYVNSYPKEYREMLVKVLTKGMNIGIGVKELNKAFGETIIQDVEIMKAEADANIVKKWFAEGREVWAELKYDGIRGFAEMGVKGVKSIKSYNMSEMDIDFMTHIRDQLNKLHVVWLRYTNEPHYFFDFEITGKMRRTVSGEVGKLIKNTAEVGCDENWLANIFDVHTWDIFDGEESKVPYTKRRHILEGVRERTLDELPNIRISKRWKVTTFQEVADLFTQVLSEGEEGLVLKCGDGVYELKRSSNWVKMKAERECDLVITGWFPGEGRRIDYIGGFNCASSDGEVVVSVGSGFKDRDFEEIMSNGPDTYIGKIVKVKFNEVISKKDSDIKSLFLPRFIGFRFDKNEANTVGYILKK
jgi:hypothetical protein